MKAAIVGGGVIGGGWAARFLLNGWDVAVCDPDPGAEKKILAVLENARRALPALYDAALPPEGRLDFVSDLRAAADGADWVQESVPERLELKHLVLGELCAAAPDAVVGSSTSGFRPSELNAMGARAIVAHPFNPVYLLALVELAGDPATCARAAALLHEVGFHPLTLRREIDAHIADRLLEAVWRESLWLVKDGIATTGEIDDAIRMGFGLRWAQMGLFETYRIAGGEAGMRHFLEQFGPALAWPWSRLTDVPDYDDALVDLIAGQSDAQSGHLSIRELERARDDNLVAMLRALKRTGAGAGGVISAHEALLATPAFPVVGRQVVPTAWLDANGHMNIARYIEVVSNAIVVFQETFGTGLDYIAAGQSFFTGTQHVRYLSEVRAGERLEVTVRILGHRARKIHVLFRIAAEGRLAATVEAILIHVDLATRRAVPMPAEVAGAVAALEAGQADDPDPVAPVLSL